MEKLLQIIHKFYPEVWEEFSLYESLPLGKGCTSITFPVDNEKVLKITTHYNQAKICRHLLDLPKHEHIVKPYEVIQLTNHYVWLIVCERLHTRFDKVRRTHHETESLIYNVIPELHKVFKCSLATVGLEDDMIDTWLYNIMLDNFCKPTFFDFTFTSLTAPYSKKIRRL